ncbi:restriction endonuclease subunit S [Acetobacter ascendens]|uniref:Type I site-specific deoxyribonuclease n=1 Tax=Acetobacter ascendens TaxID=481146 RepID=A0A1Y0V7H5_9PROT|nr:restriction endonuclease subunit S [Acetobacter ascendens]ARW11839.1 Type I site-specific deoxyribonuclease [Acetobacter ascendens]
MSNSKFLTTRKIRFTLQTLGDIIDLKRGYDLPSKDRIPGQYPIISSSGISGTHSDYQVEGPGVVTGRYGTLGQIFYEKENFWPLNTTLYVKDFKGNHPKFIYYFLKTLDFWAFSDKAAVPGLNRNDLHTANILFPNDLHYQKSIASILGSLDDKIDLNRRTNETLEAMARTLFRDWFVDFGPTRAKMTGEAPYLAPELWELFPDRLDDEGKPEGWETSAFDQCITILTGGTPKTSVPSYWNGNIPWFSVVDAPAESDVYVLDTTKKITQDGLNNSAASILPENTVIISARGTVGKLALTSGDMTMNQSCYGIRGSNGYGQYFILQALKNILTELKNNTHGSVFDTITRQTFSTISTTLPSLRLAQHYENMISKYFERILVNCQESRTLAQLRDLLLPKLMSGEISIRDAEKMVEDAA